ncbi:hypothetical protein GZ77_24455 [Endozoicomonas montiporae]|uniref:CheW-like domain-containing protein n=1 Tax=Endozoicomonas montiporae TaxID=1027273 RepID=A0A081MZP8_9GAMM|nr:hypothetical protein GZ77_24455 [Endozoicomonas montiporae]
MTHEATGLTPFELLQQMQTRTILHASEPPEYREQSAPWAGIGFTLNQHQYVVSISDITEILPVPAITPLPGTKSWAKGVSNVRGRLVPIIDLSEFLGLPAPSAQNTRRIMVIDQKPLVAGIIVDEVQGMMQFPSERFSEQASATSSDTTEAINYFIEGSYNLEKEYLVFSFDKLVRHSDFLMAANE